LTSNERILVEDIARFVVSSIQPSDYQRLSTPLLHRPRGEEIKAYIEALAKELGEWRAQNKGQGSLAVRAYVDGMNGFFGAVQITAFRRHGDRTGIVTSELAFEKLIGELQASLAAQQIMIGQDDLFKIPNIMVLVGDAFFFVKPLRRRFWLSRAALGDADQIVKTVHASAWRKSVS
jgi:hypothetical protein